jgi:hypothetical protein
MGDMADWINYGGLEWLGTDEHWEDEREGNMLACRYCNKGGMIWVQDHLGKWRLWDTETKDRHFCKEYRP